MEQFSHQTIKLSPGRHTSPQQGACVMELASMLAGEPFSDHPKSVCPVVGLILRTYNDQIDDVRRQDLYEYAARIVGSRASTEVQAARRDRLSNWTLARQSRWERFVRRVAIPPLVPWLVGDAPSVSGFRTPRHHDERAHEDVLALIDELLEMGTGSETVGCQPASPSEKLASRPSSASASANDL